MDLGQHKKTLVAVLLIGIAMALAILLYFSFSNKNRFYLVLHDVTGMQKKAPVIINGQKVGKILWMKINEQKQDEVIVKVKLDRDINIPDKSFAEKINHDAQTGENGIYIHLIASFDYLMPGDTIPVRINTHSIDSLINITQKAKENLKKSIEKLSGGEPDVSQPVNGKPVFKVQFMVSKKDIPINSQLFRDLNEVEKYHENNFFKYVTGKYTNFEKAREERNSMVEKGYKDAFIVAFIHDKRISIEEALSLMN